MCPILVASAVFLSIGPSLIAVRFSPSKQLLGPDLSFHHDGGDGGRGKSKKGGKERDRTRSDQTEWVEGWRRRRRRRRRRGTGCPPYEHGKRGTHALQVPVCGIHQDETKQLCRKGPKNSFEEGSPFGTIERG
jgi:hypothetical protein